MPKARMSSKGWVVIPKELRKKYGLRPGKEVDLVDVGEALYVVPVPDDPIEAAAGMFKGSPSMLDALLEERTLEREREEAEIALWMKRDEAKK